MHKLSVSVKNANFNLLLFFTHRSACIASSKSAWNTEINTDTIIIGVYNNN